MSSEVSRGFDTYKNYDWMYQRLVIEKKFKKEVAKECGCDNGTISRWVIRVGVQKLISHTNQNKTLIKICKQCGKEFEVAKYDKNQKYCSYQCIGISKRKRIKLVCRYCGKEFEVCPSRIRKNVKYCSYRCMGLSNRGKKVTIEQKKKQSQTVKENWQDPIIRERYTEARKKVWQDPKRRQKQREVQKKIWQNSKYKIKISKIMKEVWQEPEYQKNQAIAQNIKPNNLEQYFDKLTPDIVRYVGDFSFWIVTKNRAHNPDFKVTGQRRIIELFGDYWHEGEDPEVKIKEYAEMGWKCIVFWEHEVLNEPGRVLDETLKFIVQKR